MQREKLGSRLGFILLSAGCAIGIGNVWKFPYVAGQNGGGIFVLIYLFFLAAIGIPVMTMEFALGRASQKSPARMYQQLQPKGTKWHLHGYAALAGNYILMMFYTSVSAWLLYYFVSTAAGGLEGLDAGGVKSFFYTMRQDTPAVTGYVAVVVIGCFAVCSIGLQKGLEKVTKVMMLALLVLMMVLAGRSVFLEGGSEGLAFYLLPDLDRMRKVGVENVIVAAMNQSFFTLSLGIGAMAIFGSYLNKERALLGESVRIAALDTLVAFCSGLIIFPACSAYGVEVDSGQSLIFITLPNIFNHMPMGRFWGSLFFLFLSFAALSTVLTVFEGIIACTMDMTGWSRKKASIINCVAMLLLSMPCILGYGAWAEFKPFGGTSTVMDLEDFLVSNILLPLGSLIFVVFCTSRYGWGWKNFKAEANTGKGAKIMEWMRIYVTWVLPVAVLVLFAVGLYQYFK